MFLTGLFCSSSTKTNMLKCVFLFLLLLSFLKCPDDEYTYSTLLCRTQSTFQEKRAKHLIILTQIFTRLHRANVFIMKLENHTHAYKLVVLPIFHGILFFRRRIVIASVQIPFDLLRLFFEIALKDRRYFS